MQVAFYFWFTRLHKRQLNQEISESLNHSSSNTFKQRIDKISEQCTLCLLKRLRIDDAKGLMLDASQHRDLALTSALIRKESFEVFRLSVSELRLLRVFFVFLCTCVSFLSAMQFCSNLGFWATRSVGSHLISIIGISRWAPHFDLIFWNTNEKNYAEALGLRKMHCLQNLKQSIVQKGDLQNLLCTRCVETRSAAVQNVSEVYFFGSLDHPSCNMDQGEWLKPNQCAWFLGVLNRLSPNV